MLAFGRPDVLLQPAHERQIIGEAPHERHRRMRMRVDEPRDEDVVRQLEALVGRKAAFRFDRGNKRFDAPIAHRDCVALEDAAGGLDRDGPARPDQETVRVNSLECISYFGLTSAFP